MKCSLTAALVVALTLVGAAYASPQKPFENGVGARWPAGSVQTEANARQALADVGAAREKLSAAYVEQLQACKDTVFTDFCRGKARSARDEAEQELARVETEARAVTERNVAKTAPAPATPESYGTEWPPELRDSSILKRWPEGSIQSEEQAKLALEDVDTSRDKLKSAYRRAYNQCIGKVLVSRCWDEARADQYARGKELRQVELQAKDFLRAEEARKERDRKAAVLAKEEARAGQPGPAARSAEKSRGKAQRAKAAPSAPKRHEPRATDDSARRAQAAERARSAERARQKVEKNRAKAARRAKDDAANEAAYLERQQQAEKTRAVAQQKQQRSEQRRAERLEKARKEQELRIEAQKRADEQKNRAQSALNPFD